MALYGCRTASLRSGNYLRAAVSAFLTVCLASPPGAAYAEPAVADDISRLKGLSIQDFVCLPKLNGNMPVRWANRFQEL